MKNFLRWFFNGLFLFVLVFISSSLKASPSGTVSVIYSWVEEETTCYWVEGETTGEYYFDDERNMWIYEVTAHPGNEECVTFYRYYSSVALDVTGLNPKCSYGISCDLISDIVSGESSVSYIFTVEGEGASLGVVNIDEYFCEPDCSFTVSSVEATDKAHPSRKASNGQTLHLVGESEASVKAIISGSYNAGCPIWSDGSDQAERSVSVSGSETFTAGSSSISIQVHSGVAVQYQLGMGINPLTVLNEKMGLTNTKFEVSLDFAGSLSTCAVEKPNGPDVGSQKDADFTITGSFAGDDIPIPSCAYTVPGVAQLGLFASGNIELSGTVALHAKEFAGQSTARTGTAGLGASGSISFKAMARTLVPSWAINISGEAEASTGVTCQGRVTDSWELQGKAGWTGVQLACGFHGSVADDTLSFDYSFNWEPIKGGTSDWKTIRQLF